jgi:hypothetical protein
MVYGANRFSFVVSAILILSGISDSRTQAQVLFDSQSGHYYQLVTGSYTWDQARVTAAAQTMSGLPGHLATITSAAEQDFIVNGFTGEALRHAWIGGFQPAGSLEPDGGWQWITGEPWSYTHWNPGEPNNAGNENAVHFAGVPLMAGYWNDASSDFTGGYVVEFQPVPELPAYVYLAVAICVFRLFRCRTG